MKGEDKGYIAIIIKDKKCKQTFARMPQIICTKERGKKWKGLKDNGYIVIIIKNTKCKQNICANAANSMYK